MKFRLDLVAIALMFAAEAFAQNSTTRIDSGPRTRSAQAVRSATSFSAPRYAAPVSRACADMLTLQLPDTQITAAQTVPPDPANGLPEYCDVQGLTQQTIGFDVRLPAQWNGKMYFAGNRGFAGHIRYDTSTGLARGYATVSTDTGHQDQDILDASWALNDRPAEINFGFRAVHVTTLLGKRLIAAYYRHAPERAYFDGCSTGGGQALHEAELYPEDYDGYIAGAPVLDFTGTLMMLNWKMQAMHATPTSTVLTLDDLPIIGAAVLAQCDASDGLVDGLIADPRKCHFNPDTLLCKAGGTSSCLTAQKVQALKLIYQGPRDAHGEQLYPGLSKGGETPDASGNGWDGMINNSDGTSPEFILQDQFLRYLAFPVDDPDYDWSTFNFTRDPPRLAFMGAILNATSDDLSRLAQLGRKLLIYQGWSDETVAPTRTLEFFEEVRERLGEHRAARSIRLFMAPGMFHCGGGPGPDTFDTLGAMEQWVEAGMPPDQMQSTHYDDSGNPDRTRPLCAYPKVARYNGSGSIDDSASFSCAVPSGGDVE